MTRAAERVGLDLGLDDEAGEVTQAAVDASLAGGGATNGTAHPALGGGCDRVRQGRADVEFVGTVVAGKFVASEIAGAAGDQAASASAL